MQALNQYQVNLGGYSLPSSHSNNNDSAFLRVKVMQRESLQEKVNKITAQIKGRKELSDRFEQEAQGCINKLLQQKEKMHYLRQDSSGAEAAIAKTRMSVQEEKSKAWRDIRELEIELVDTEFEMNKRQINNSRFYQTTTPAYRVGPY